MNTLRSSRQPEAESRRRRPSRPLAVSVALHIVVAFGLVRFLISPSAFTMIFGRVKSPPVPAERIGFLRLPKSSGPAVVGKSGGDNKPLSKTPAPKLVAPTSIPSTIPVTPAPTGARPDGGSGPLVGGGGPTKGIRPNYTD